MNDWETRDPEALNPTMIAPCGMNCGLCVAYLRQKNRCSGCNGDDAHKPKSCVVCHIKHCEETGDSEGAFCFECAKFPCARIRHLDRRYRTKYGMSMIENLESVRALGVEAFVTREKEKWKCPGCGEVICVHRDKCIYCGRPRSWAEVAQKARAADACVICTAEAPVKPRPLALEFEDNST